MASPSCSLPSPEELKGAAQGTILYLGLYFPVFMAFKGFSKSKLLQEKKQELQSFENDAKRQVYLSTIKYYNARDILALRADRTIANYIEKGFVFLPLLWLHAVFVDSSKSLIICILFTCSNALFPILFKDGSWIPGVPDLMGLLCIAPTLLIISFLFFEVTFKFCFDVL